MKCLRLPLLLGALVALGPASASAQWPPDSLVNLQVLPEDMSVRQIVGMMRGFAGGLGVRCIHCHVGDDPSDLSSTDFVSDDKIEKQKAREMIRMVQRINNELLANLPERSDPPIEVTCATCHHGVTKPVGIRTILADVALEHGADSAIAQYNQMREQYYGSYSYDFKPFTLANVAESIARQAPDAGLALCEYNLTLYPEDLQTFLAMAQIYQRQGDIDGAIGALERGLEVEPDNEFFKQTIERLKNRE
jgi:tetratricopeptide (TPR) repeat protein